MKKTVCLIHIDKIINRIGGAEKVLADMANALAARNFNVHVLCYDTEEGKPFYTFNKNVHLHLCIDTQGKFIQNLFKLACLPLPTTTRRRCRFALKMQRISCFFKPLLMKILPDVVIAFSPDLIYLLNKIIKIQQPVVSMLHSDPRFFISNKNFPFYKNCFISDKDIIQVLVPAFIPLIQAQIPNIRILEIPNYIQLGPNITLSNYKSHSIINTSRISQEKRHELLIDAFAKISRKYPDWTLDLWGPTDIDPRYTAKLMKKIQELGLINKVIFHGETKDIHSKLSQASIFCFPSAFEGFSLALLEALAHGLPVIACKDCLSVVSILHNNIEAFFTEPSPDALSKALETLMSDSSLRHSMGQKSLTLSSKFSDTIIWDRWERLIQSL